MASYSSEVSTGGSQKDLGNLAKEISDIINKHTEKMINFINEWEKKMSDMIDKNSNKMNDRFDKHIEKKEEIGVGTKIDDRGITARSEDSIESVDDRTQS